MREKFPGYYRPTEADFRLLWSDGVVVVDANVLLNLYRYSEDTRRELVALLRATGNRLWLPHQAAQEFHENRLGVIAKQAGAYDDIERAMEEALKKLEGSLAEYSRHPVIETKDVLQRIKGFHEEIGQELKRKRAEHPNLLVEDPILEEVSDLFAGKVGEPYESTELAKRQAEAKDRYSKAIPPGYADAKSKDEMRSCGDYILWSQVVEHAIVTKRPVILVTDDLKDDWWWRFQGRTIGPRPELVAEMRTRGKARFHLYRSASFMEEARLRLKRRVEQEAINEVRNIQRAHEEATSARRRAEEAESAMRSFAAMVDDSTGRLAEVDGELSYIHHLRAKLALELGGAGDRAHPSLVEHLQRLEGRQAELEARRQELVHDLNWKSAELAHARQLARRAAWRFRHQATHQRISYVERLGNEKAWPTGRSEDRVVDERDRPE